MKKIFICLVFLFLTATGYCGQSNKIELNDGSVIYAEVVSLDNGIYTVNAPSLGVIKLEASKIKKIESLDTTSGGDIKSQMDKVKNKIMNNPETLKSVTDLAADQQIQEIMKDPEIVNAVKSADMKSLMSNEKFIGLVNNPKIQEIREKIKASEDSSK